ncbi:hypothetical protein HOU02_gp080 [Caulobacter phage CcrBL9]|uniref:Uncharacterized protein n=1 Tax=Caulobacter phage CcrBL9 TaxID=2283270 RepID=A0A385EB54_9CAUD|nr:hypothetical protein HOU02_gp080 [Caulobacter phage CcrBL9]AXQ69104.1 hypothetical protein CcrBL9_gp080c [Caulobacter phage CcrBL9]
MSLIEKIRSDLAAAKGDPKQNIPARPVEVSLLNLLLSDATSTLSSVKYNVGAKVLRKQAEAEGWPLGQLEQAKKDNAAFFKPLRAESLAKVQAEYAAHGEQAVLDAIGVVNDEYDTLLAGADAAAEQTAAEEGWPLGRLEQGLIDLGVKARQDPTDEEMTPMVRNFANAVTENLKALATRPASEDNAAKIAKATEEAAILARYLPQNLTTEDLSAEIAAFKAANPGANMGQYMAHLKANFAGRYDGKEASGLVQAAIKGEG